VTSVAATAVRVKRVGHGGASALARANTFASFDAALDAGVDMIEFDVRGCRGRLVLAHTRAHARVLDCPPLERALAHLAQRRFRDVELNVDVKHPGCERGTLDALRRTGLIGRSLVTSQWAEVVDTVRALDRRVGVGISIGGRIARRSRRWRDWREAVLDGLRSGRFDALMAQHRLVGPALAADVAAAGGDLYAWTVNDRRTLARLAELPVTGIATADPRLFSLPG
jgi:glycerophosphoryl diester phosphodiesterase